MSYGLEALGLSSLGLSEQSASGGGGTTEINCSVGVTSSLGLAADVDLPTAGTITVTTPVAYRAFQRNGSNQADIAITGTYTGAPTTIEASFNGGAYATIVASPTGGSFSGTLSAQAMGQGTLTVRFSNDTPTADTKAFITIGDVFIVMGQSNNVGQATSFVAPSTSSFRVVELGLNNVWSEVVETDPNPFSDNTGAVYTPHQVAATAGNGSYFGALATKIMAAGVPVAFVPNAIGSTSISGWLPFSDHHSLGSAYGVSLTRAELVGGHKAMLLWQGENDAVVGTSQSAYETSLNTLANAWFTDTGKKTFIYSINTAGAGTAPNNAAIRAAQRKIGRSNSNAISGPRMEDAWATNVHYTTTGDINEVASRAYDVIAAQYYGGTAITCGVGVTTSVGPTATVMADSTNINCGVGVTTSAGVTAAVMFPTIVSVTYTEDNDTHSASVYCKASSTITWVEADDVISIAGSLHIAANTSYTEESDSHSILSTIVGVTTGTVSWMESNDIYSVQVVLQQPVSVGMSWMESDDIIHISSSVLIPISGSINWTEANDTSYIIVSLPSAVAPIPANIQVKFYNPKYKIAFRRG